MNTASLPATTPYPRGTLLIVVVLPLLAALAAGCLGYARSGQGCITLALAVCAGAAAYSFLHLRLYRRQYDQYASRIRESEQGFIAAIDNASYGMALVSAEGKFLHANKALSRIVGYSENELLKIDFQAITHPDDLDADLRYVQQVLERKIETYSMEKRYIRKDSSIVWILLTVSAVWDAAGNFRYFISQVQDISERKSLQEKLRESEAKLRRQ